MKTKYLKFKLIVVLIIFASSYGIFAQRVCISIYNLMPVFLDSSPFMKENDELSFLFEERQPREEPVSCLNLENFSKIKLNYTGENIFSDWIGSHSFIWLKPKLNILNDAYRKKY